MNLVGTPFVKLPPMAPIELQGHTLTQEQVEMVLNDQLLMDATAEWGKYGPLYENVCGQLELEILKHARAVVTAHAVEIPAKLRPPQ